MGARVILVDGFLAGYLRRGEHELLLFLPEAEPQRAQCAREVARMLLHLAVSREETRRGMLLGEINGEAAVSHPASRVFIEEGFVPTAMGLQARLRPGARALLFDYAQGTPSDSRGVGPESGIAIAGLHRGGIPMAEPRRSGDDLVDNPAPDETRETEHERVRSSNDHDQAKERAGDTAPHNDGYDSAVRGNTVIDPDSAESDVDRDDTLTD